MDTLPKNSRFYLHIRGPELEILDFEGSEHAGLAAVAIAMLDGARDMLGHDLMEGRPLDLRGRIDAEVGGVVVASLAFRDSVVIRR